MLKTIIIVTLVVIGTMFAVVKTTSAQIEPCVYPNCGGK